MCKRKEPYAPTAHNAQAYSAHDLNGRFQDAREVAEPAGALQSTLPFAIHFVHGITEVA